MRVLIDTEIYRRQSTGGISRIFTESLRRIGAISPEIAIRLSFIEHHFRNRLPEAPWITRPMDFRPRRFEAAVNFSIERKWKPQIIHSTYFTTPKLRGARSVATVYDFIHEEYPGLMGDSGATLARKRAALLSADRIIAISHVTKAKTLEHIGGAEKKVSVIYPGVGEVFLAGESNGDVRGELRSLIGNARPYWLYVGTRRAYKNFGTLLRAFTRIASRAEADLVLIGGESELSGWEADLLISKRLEQRVHLLGHLSDDLLKAAYGEAAAFVFPSCAEGFGIPLLEAMACGTPILASDISVFREVASGRVEFFDPHEEETLAELLLQSLDHRPSAETLEETRRYASQFTWAEGARKLADVYRSCASQ